MPAARSAAVMAGAFDETDPDAEAEAAALRRLVERAEADAAGGRRR